MEIIQGTSEIYDEIVDFVSRCSDEAFVKKGFNKTDKLLFKRIVNGESEDFFTVRYGNLKQDIGPFKADTTATVVSFKDINILFPLETLETLKDVLLNRESIQEIRTIDIFRDALKKPIL